MQLGPNIFPGLISDHFFITGIRPDIKSSIEPDTRLDHESQSDNMVINIKIKKIVIIVALIELMTSLLLKIQIFGRISG